MLRGVLLALVCAAVSVGVGWIAGGTPWHGVPALAVCAAVAMLVQWVAWVPSAIFRTEKYYDITGTLAAVLMATLALGIAAAERPFSVRPMMGVAMVLVWSLRLGSFLLQRVQAAGRDPRFDAIKVNPGRFLVAWSLQGLWIFLTTLAALIQITEPAHAWKLYWTDALGWGIYAAGFAIEVIADRQKSAFNADPANKGRWIDTGLWARSRHPNYFGEILLWFGVFVAGLGIYQDERWIAALSPVFVVLLLTRGSGVPLLEARADAKWGEDPAYQAYKARTPVLLPRLWG